MLRDRAPSWRYRGRSQAVNQAQDVGEQASRDCDLSELERDIATVADDLGAGLDQLLAISANVGLWLGAAVQRCPLGLPLSARKQTFVPQCPVSAELRQLQVRERTRR